MKSHRVLGSTHVGRINQSWEQCDCSSLASLYSVELLAHLSSRGNADLPSVTAVVTISDCAHRSVWLSLLCAKVKVAIALDTPLLILLAGDWNGPILSGIHKREHVRAHTHGGHENDRNL